MIFYYEIEAPLVHGKPYLPPELLAIEAPVQSMENDVVFEDRVMLRLKRVQALPRSEDDVLAGLVADRVVEEILSRFSAPITQLYRVLEGE